jgi:hypothetical protein
MNPEIPYGMCQCGCGKPAPIARKSSYGNVEGQPLQYIPNHSPTCRQSRHDYKMAAKGRGKAFVAEYLATHPCVDCGENDPRCLDLDHRDPATKRGSLADLITRTQVNNAVLEAEIAKCDVRCANCHRIKHYEERQQ